MLSLTCICCRDRDRKRREEKKNTDSGKSKAGVIDDSILEKSEDPHEIMEVSVMSSRLLLLVAGVCDFALLAHWCVPSNGVVAAAFH